MKASKLEARRPLLLLALAAAALLVSPVNAGAITSPSSVAADEDCRTLCGGEDEEPDDTRPPPDDDDSPPHYYKYPVVPDGHAAIVNRFGPACGGNANENSNVNYPNRLIPGGHVDYRPNYHKKLGAWATTGVSSNHDDIKFVLQEKNIFWKVRGGVWGYNCRKIQNSDKWSTHAWGIAIDINAAYEVYGDNDCASNTVTHDVVATWKYFRWRWGGDFSCASGSFDAMHFQYAKGY